MEIKSGTRVFLPSATSADFHTGTVLESSPESFVVAWDTKFQHQDKDRLWTDFNPSGPNTVRIHGGARRFNRAELHRFQLGTPKRNTPVEAK
jgi:hypothetical protein